MIKGFKTFNQDSELAISVNNMIEYQQFVDMDFNTLNEDMLSEFKMPDISGALSKAGLHVKKGRGLLQIIASSGIHLAKIFHAAIKASGGDADAKVNLKELLSKKIKKEDVIDFLLKLDQLTLHVITGPIHAIEAVTGWHIAAAIHKVRNTANDVVQKGKEIIAKLKDIAKDLEGSGKKYIEKVSSSVEKFFLPQIDTKSVKV